MERTGMRHKEARDDIVGFAWEIMKTDKKEPEGKEMNLGEATARLLEETGYGWMMEDQNGDLMEDNYLKGPYIFHF